MIPISALEKHCYCPRQAALIHVDGVWKDNAHTVRGSRGHSRADAPGRRVERGRLVVRSVPVFSDQLGLIGRADAVEVWGADLVPVEYKVGRRHGDAAEVQLCGVALCLEEMLGVDIAEGAVWYEGPRRRLPVRFSDALRDRTLEVVNQVAALMRSRSLPDAPNDERCTECQLIDVCLPALVADGATVDSYLASEVSSCV